MAGTSGVYDLIWKHIGVIDLKLNSSQINVYRYNFNLTSPLPQIELVSRLSNDLVPQEDTHNVLGPLLEHAQEVIPADQQKLTPIYLYGSDSYNHFPTDESFKTIQTSCRYLKTNGIFLAPQCDIHTSFVNGNEHAALSWIAGINKHRSSELEVLGDQEHNNVTNIPAVIDISTFNIHFAMMNSGQSKKVDLLRFGYKSKEILPNRSKRPKFEQHFVDLETFTINLSDHVNFQELKSCIPKGRSFENIEGTGNFSDCSVVLNSLINPLEELLDSVKLTQMEIGLIGGFGSSDENMSNAVRLCELEPDDKDSTNTACLKAVMASKIVHTLNLRNVTHWEEPVDWSLGRVFIYADIEAALRASSDAAYMGLHVNTGGSLKWTFGINDDHVVRPDQKTQGIHLFGSTVILIVLLAGIVLIYLRRTNRLRSLLPCLVWRRVHYGAISDGGEPVIELDDYDIDPLDDSDASYAV